MAKGKYAEWLDEEHLLLLEGWARDGLTDEQIASNMGIVPSTFYDWKNKFPELSKAIKKGKEIVDYQVENALLKSALSGNITAQIFWLKNRRPKKWRDKPEIEIKNSGGVLLIPDIAEELTPPEEHENE